jgi:ABC-2 type transport system permease protein
MDEDAHGRRHDLAAARRQQAAARIPPRSACPASLGQAVVVTLAVLAISGEYGTGMIRVTLTAMPRRATMLAAKATVLTGMVLAAGTVAVLGSVLAGRLILPGHGFTPAHGYPLLSLADGPYLRAAAGSVLYLSLIGLLALGIATAVRDSAAAIGVVLGLLYLFPVVAAAVSSQQWQRHLEQIAPMSAGLQQAHSRFPAVLLADKIHSYRQFIS